MPGELRETHILQRMAVGPVPDVVDERRDDERRGVPFIDRGGEMGIAPESAKEGQR